MIQTQVAVATTPTALASGGGSPAGLLIENTGNALIYVGDATVSTTTGTPIPPNAAESAYVGASDTLYAVCASGTVTVNVTKNQGGPAPEAYGTVSVQKVNAGFLAPGQTAKSAQGTQATSTTLTTSVPLWTVTAGKTLYITDIAIYSDNAVQIAVQIRAATVPIFRARVRDLAPIQLPGIETQYFGTTGQAIDLLLPITAGGVQNIDYDIQGFEQ